MSKQLAKPIFWVFTLYFMQGVPYALVMLVSAILLKQFAFTNSEIAFYTSLFILPWVIKFFFAPFFEQITSKKTLVIIIQYLLAAISLCIAIFIYLQAFKVAISLFFLMAFVASCHDISTDGFYLISLNRDQQIRYVGIRSLAFQFARLCCQGGVVILVGFLLQYFPLNKAWMLGFLLLAITMATVASYHVYVLPKIVRQISATKRFAFLPIFKAFFAKAHIFHIICFVFFYNIAEAQLIKIVPLFLLDSPAAGGLQLNVQQVGLLYGSFGIAFMILGVFVSSWLIRLYGLRKCLITMTALLLFSQIGYLIISSNIGQINWVWVSITILLGQFCYGLSNNAYMVSLLDLVREHEYSMSFYAIVTAIMAMGMMIPGAISGYIQHQIGYFNFYIWVMLLQAGVLFYTKYVITHLNYEHSDAQGTSPKHHQT